MFHSKHPSDWKQPIHQEIQFPISYHVKLDNSIVCPYSYWDYQHLFSPKFQG